MEKTDKKVTSCRFKQTGYCTDAACAKACLFDTIRDTVTGAHLKDDEALLAFAWDAHLIGLKREHLPRWVRDAIAAMRIAQEQNFDLLMRPAGAWAETHYNVKALAIIAGRRDWSIAKTVGTLKGLAWRLVRSIEVPQQAELELVTTRFEESSTPGVYDASVEYRRKRACPVTFGVDLAAGDDKTVLHSFPDRHVVPHYARIAMLGKGGFYEGLVELLEKQGYGQSDAVGDPAEIEVGLFIIDTLKAYGNMAERVKALREG